MGTTVAILTLDHLRQSRNIGSPVLHPTVTSETFDLLIPAVLCMKFLHIVMFVHSETMTIQADRVGYITRTGHLALMTRFFTACLVLNKFTVINGNKTTLDDLIRYFVAISA
jgi:hypothetical protein